MTITYKRAGAILFASTVLLCGLLTWILSAGRDGAAGARPVSAGSLPALQPYKVTKSGAEIRADYRRTNLAAPRHVHVAHASAAQIRAGFSVLSRRQTASERGDFDIQQFIEDRPTAQVDGARALNAAHTVWIVPTTDDQLCIGMKTPDDPAVTFVNACGPAANALTTGIAMTHDGGKLALLPDDATSVQVKVTGAPDAVSRDASTNYVWLPQGGTVSFTDASGAQTL